MRGLSQIDMNIYAGDSLDRSAPSDQNYINGVKVNFTAPAKWWNWLLNKATALFKEIKADKNALYSEYLSVLDSVDMTPTTGVNTQLSDAINDKVYTAVINYDNEEITEEIGDTMVTHKKNQPYVIGHTLYIPSTELL